MWMEFAVLCGLVVLGLLWRRILGGWNRKKPAVALPQATTPITILPSAFPLRRFKTAEIAEHLDMALLGQLCLGVSLKNYCDLLCRVFQQQSGSLASLLAALDGRDCAALGLLAHAFKGETASLGLCALAAQALVCERDGAGFSPEQCAVAARDLRVTWQTSLALCQRMGLVTHAGTACNG